MAAVARHYNLSGLCQPDHRIGLGRKPIHNNQRNQPHHQKGPLWLDQFALAKALPSISRDNSVFDR